LNLINNALDAIDDLDEKWIEISAVQDADTIKVYVKDSGHGIPFEVQKKIQGYRSWSTSCQRYCGETRSGPEICF
jgi:C4-dicarboxylate-specific signal transduction histidine kinase